MREHDGCQIVRLAAEGGVETWLDLTTGRQLVGRVERGAPPTVGGEAASGLGSLADVAVAAVEAAGFGRPSADDGVVALPVRGARSMYECVVVTSDEYRVVTAYCVLPSHVPESRRSAMVEAIARANFGLHTGAFEMDLGDGELRFRDGANLGRHLPSVSMVRDLIRFAIFMCDRYHDALMGVAFGGAEPGAAIAEVEGGA